MATVKLSTLSITKDASSIVIRDITEDYSTTPLEGTLKIRYWSEEDFTDIELSASQIASLRSTSGLTLDSTLLGISASGYKFEDGIHQVQFWNSEGAGDLKILVNKAAEACIVKKIGKLAEAECDCIDDEKQVAKMIRWRFAADVQFDCKDFDGAHNLIVAINKLCGTGDCKCSS